jgi:hypothetical protein
MTEEDERWMRRAIEVARSKGTALRAECASLYHPPDADLPREEQANL